MHRYLCWNITWSHKESILDAYNHTSSSLLLNYPSIHSHKTYQQNHNISILNYVLHLQVWVTAVCKITRVVTNYKHFDEPSILIRSFVVWQDPGRWISGIGPLWHPIVRYQMTTTRKQLFKYLPVVVGLLCLRYRPIKSVSSCSQCFNWNLECNIKAIKTRKLLSTTTPI